MGSRIIAVLGVAFLNWAPAANAQVVTYDFSGVIVGTTDVSTGGTAPGGSIGDGFSGSFSYQSNTPYIACSTTACGYTNFITAFSYQLDGQTYNFDPSGNANAGAGIAGNGGVQEQIQLTGPNGTAGPLSQTFGLEASAASFNGDAAESFRTLSLAFGSTNLSSFSTYQSLPTTLGSASSYNEQFPIDGIITTGGPWFVSRLYNEGAHGYGQAVGEITLLTAAPEIDPASAVSGLALLLGSLSVLRSRKRDRRHMPPETPRTAQA